MFPDLSEYSFIKEGSMSVTLNESSIVSQYISGSSIGSQTYKKNVDLTNISKIKFTFTTGGSYSDTMRRFYIFGGVMPLTFNPANTYVGSNESYINYYAVYAEYHTRNSSASFELDVSELVGEYNIVFSMAGWTVTVSNVEYVEIPQTPFYTVVFNANGGTGSMNDLNVDVDVPTPLTLNTYTRDDYIFTGWSRSASATSPTYEDGETVLNLAEENETITLYAVWRKSPLNIILQTNLSEPNKVNKEVENITTMYGTLRTECSVTDPVIIVEVDLDTIRNCNYITIRRFRRSYFVINIRSIRNGLVELTCHVDVLSSFKAELLTNSAIIAKSEKDWNLYLNDGSLKTYQNSEIYTKLFPSGFTTQEFVLAVAGS